MTGFEYTAALGMLQEGQTEEGLASIRDIRQRYDGQRRSPFDEAECGHHYARAMIAWAAALVMSGFQFSAVEQALTMAARRGSFFWANGYAWGTCQLEPREEQAFQVRLSVLHGQIELKELRLREFGTYTFPATRRIALEETCEITVRRS
jgi:hypothetical protein